MTNIKIPLKNRLICTLCELMIAILNIFFKIVVLIFGIFGVFLVIFRPYYFHQYMDDIRYYNDSTVTDIGDFEKPEKHNKNGNDNENNN